MLVLPLALLVSVASAAASVVAPTLSRRVLHERRSTVPNGWTLRRRADPDTVVPLSIALRQSNLEHLDAYLLDVSDPLSPNYGKLWSPARVAQTFRPSKETLDTVHSWLVNDGLDPSSVQLSRDGGYMLMNVTVADAERLLAAEYYVYQHTDTGVEHVGCHHGYHLPEHITAHVDLVTPTVEFGGVRLAAQLAKRSSASPAAGKKMKMYRPNGPGKTYMDEKVCARSQPSEVMIARGGDAD